MAAGFQGAVPVATKPGSRFVANCVFCLPEAHPHELLQSERLAVIPDRYPLVPGHMLVITREHFTCMGAADREVLQELPPLAEKVAAFQRDQYGTEPLMWENGVSGQTVFHAHLHLIPINVDDLLEELAKDPGSLEIEGWQQVADRYRETGEYHYIHLRRRTWLVEGNGAMNWEGRRRLALAAGLQFSDGRWRRPTRDEDVDEVARRWRIWMEAEEDSTVSREGSA